jgi:hypothetical protein
MAGAEGADEFAFGRELDDAAGSVRGNVNIAGFVYDGAAVAGAELGAAGIVVEEIRDFDVIKSFGAGGGDGEGEEAKQKTHSVVHWVNAIERRGGVSSWKKG